MHTLPSLHIQTNSQVLSGSPSGASDMRSADLKGQKSNYNDDAKLHVHVCMCALEYKSIHCSPFSNPLINSDLGIKPLKFRKDSFCC